MQNTLLQPKDLIKQRRESLGLTQKEFACLLNLKESGDRTISGWERGEHIPSNSKLNFVRNLSTHIPFKNSIENFIKNDHKLIRGFLFFLHQNIGFPLVF